MWTDSESKEKKQQTEFHNIVAFGKLADICNQYLTKGSLVMVEGRLQTRSWQGQNGETKYRTEIVAERLQMGPKTAQKKEEKTAEAAEPKTEKLEEIQVEEEPPADEIKTEDIPF